jgi:Endosomal/lysosomal potassium channel TMEM175
LLSLWPRYLGYFLSFVGIAVFWTIHHSIFRPVKDYDRRLLYLNFLFLMVVAFVPFPTALLGEYGDHQLPVAVYAATLAVGRLLLTAIYWYSTRNDRLLAEPPGARHGALLPRQGRYDTGHLLALHRSFLPPLADVTPWAHHVGVRIYAHRFLSYVFDRHSTFSGMG